MKSLLAAAALLLSAAAGSSDHVLTPAEFRDRMAAALAPGQTIQPIDERNFRAKAADGTELTVNIDNAYRDYLAAPERLDQIMARAAEASRERLSAGHEPVDQLVVIVRPSDYIVRSLPPGASTEAFVPARPMAGDVSYFLAIDSPSSIRSAAKADLVRWGLDEDAAWRLAVSHIKARVGEVGIVQLGEDGPNGIGAASGLAPSILADPALCGKNRKTTDADAQIVLLYARDMYLFTAPSDIEGTRRFWRSVKREVAAGRSMSATPLTCRDGHWTVVPIP